ncbi:MAG TPA: hypothetical protein VLB01_08155 [Thermodesulfobacteriota bacterium]|nr:hypothetical protein [Thermodesulfobacteriota bacterium]
MKKTLHILNELKSVNLIKDYAIGGTIAVVFHTEPIFTVDLDIYYIPISDETILTLETIYDYLEKKGYKPEDEYVIIEGVPVQFLAVYNELIEESVRESITYRYEDEEETKVVRAEHLIAILIQTGRPKDKERLIKMLETVKIDKERLNHILEKYNLKAQYDILIENE